MKPISREEFESMLPDGWIIIHWAIDEVHDNTSWYVNEHGDGTILAVLVMPDENRLSVITATTDDSCQINEMLDTFVNFVINPNNMRRGAYNVGKQEWEKETKYNEETVNKILNKWIAEQYMI